MSWSAWAAGERGPWWNGTRTWRRIISRSNGAHQGSWDKSAVDSHEVRGKTLGIIGDGNIGSQLSNLAEALGMRVIFYDHTDKLRHGNTEPTATMQELLAQSDVVSLHVPETAEAITNYVARRIVERERSLVATAPAAPVPARSASAVWMFFLGFIAGAAALFALALFASLRSL